MRIIVLLLIYFELSLFYAIVASVHTPPPHVKHAKTKAPDVKQVKTTPVHSESKVGAPLAFPVAPTQHPSTPISLTPKPRVPKPVKTTLHTTVKTTLHTTVKTTLHTTVKTTLHTTAKSTIHRFDGISTRQPTPVHKKPIDVALNRSKNAEIGTESVSNDVITLDPDQIASETSIDTTIQTNLSAENAGADENVNPASTTTLDNTEPTDVAFSRSNNAEIGTESMSNDVTPPNPDQIAPETSIDTAIQTNLSAENDGTHENVNLTTTTTLVHTKPTHVALNRSNNAEIGTEFSEEWVGAGEGEADGWG